MTKSIPCPCEDCKVRCHTVDGLFVHLYRRHHKSEVTKALVGLYIIVQGGLDVVR